jgi:hypothetical protein
MRSFFILLLTFLSITVFSQDYEAGYYFDYSGQKHKGLIRHMFSPGGRNRTDNYIEYKTDSLSKKKKLDIDDIYSFVIGQDSFCIATNFSIHGLSFYERDFVQVLASGKVNLYKHYTTSTAQSAPIGGFGAVAVSMTMTLAHTTLFLNQGERTVKLRDDKEVEEAFPKLTNEYPELLEVKRRTSDEEIIEAIKDFNSKFSSSDLISKKATIIFYRVKLGEFPEPLKITINGDLNISLSRLDQTKLQFDDLTSVTICSDSDTTECLTVTAIWHQDTYIDCSMNRRGNIRISETDYDDAAFYVFRAEQKNNGNKR